MNHLAIAFNVKKAMDKKKKMAMGGDVPNEHDQDMKAFESDEPEEMLAMDAGEAEASDMRELGVDRTRDQDESLSDQEDVENKFAHGGMNEKLHPYAKYARGGMHMDPMSMAKAIRMKKMASGGMFESDDGAIEANEAEGKKHNMDDWVSSGDAEIGQLRSPAHPEEMKKARIRKALSALV